MPGVSPVHRRINASSINANLMPDHVETDDTYKEYAELQYAKQREAPVSEFDKSKRPSISY
jgi:hypothetical protein